ncbi:MAG: TolC family protein [Acidobacteria bacterium]|nr:MAG: TolC family protein [Acidobacteriota bacterium]PYY03889.1 MAG: TolC family protein [Acidobacteriota bacterium]PYY24307.1 MAG: TolC family protein [Acidobacteriota bacterium]
MYHLTHSLQRAFLMSLAVALVLCSRAWPEQPDTDDITHGAQIFPNVLAPYKSRTVAEPNLTNSVRLNGLVQNGNIMLSLDDAMALALENNLDLVIARYNLPIADTDILRTKSGANVRGVNTGIVQGTPGAGIGGLGGGAAGGGAGGTVTAAGGAGTGTGGLVSSTLGVGPAIDSFDPALTSTLGIQHSDIPQSNTVTSGVPALLQNTGTVNFGYQQGFPTGTLFNVTFNNSRVTTNSTRTFLVPQLNSNFLFQLRQHLLEGFGLAANRRFMTIAKNNREIADEAFRQQVIFSVTQIETLYWELVTAFEDVKAKERAVASAQQLEANNRKQVQAGTIAQIEIVNAQAQVAASQEALITSQTNLQLQQLLMKNAITRNENDPVIASAGVIPTDRMQLPAAEPVLPTQDLINDALTRRPELAQARIDLTNRTISKRSARNALLPTVDLVGNYGGNGLAGALNPNFSSTSPITTATNGGYQDALTATVSHPTYFVGFSVDIPIRNRAAQADQVRSELEYRQAQVRLQQVQNTIAIAVRNAQFSVQQNRAAVDAALKARDFATQSLEAEQKKLAQGLSTTYNVLTQISNVSTAESNLVNAMSAYEQSKLNLDVVTGRLLDTLGISIGDAESGNVTHMPHAPYAVRGNDVITQPVPQFQPQQTGVTPQPRGD